jgi:hypothetical protein
VQRQNKRRREEQLELAKKILNENKNRKNFHKHAFCSLMLAAFLALSLFLLCLLNVSTPEPNAKLQPNNNKNVKTQMLDSIVLCCWNIDFPGDMPSNSLQTKRKKKSFQCANILKDSSTVFCVSIVELYKRGN